MLRDRCAACAVDRTSLYLSRHAGERPLWKRRAASDEGVAHVKSVKAEQSVIRLDRLCGSRAIDNDVPTLTDVLRAVLSVTVDDGVTYQADAMTTQVIRDTSLYSGVRVSVPPK
jgi:hypothetical protein